MDEIGIDVVVVGAGLSGISGAAWLAMKLPSKSYVVLEGRDDIGGTWDLFRYPGIRSDSDMHTLGFSFFPWRDKDAIAAGGKIKDYIGEAIDRFGIRQRLRLGHRVISADWCSERARWRVCAEQKDGTRVNFVARYLYMGSGYYDYTEGHNPVFEGQEDFTGQVVHPQFWPENLDYAGKKVLVIGSGATAVTLIPTMAQTAEHVTMLQRSPSYIVARPGRDKEANRLKALLPANVAGAAVRWKNVLTSRKMRQRMMKDPTKARPMLIGMAKASLPQGYDMTHFTPKHQPWEQRICLAPDGDFYRAIHRGKASVVTDTVERFVPEGVKLASGRVLEADIVVTATGLKLLRGGGVQLRVDGEPINLKDTVIYKGAMYSNIPNFSLVFGYTGSSWTLKADLAARYMVRVLKELDRRGADIAVPAADVASMKTTWMQTFTSGYVVRAREDMPRQGVEHPWQVHQDYVTDRRIMLKEPVADGVLRLVKAGEPWQVKGGAAAPGKISSVG